MTPDSPIRLTPIGLDDIRELREQYRREMNCQIVHDSWHARGFTDSLLLRLGGRIVGYGSVGGVPGEPRDTVKEFFVLPQYRGAALPLFRAVLEATRARAIQAQTNDVLLLLMLYDCAVEIASETILFADAVTTHHTASGVLLRRVTGADRASVFAHTVEPIGDWGLERDGELVATGGVLSHYNPPYSDIYMEVAGPYQRRGLGSYLVQELKRICRDMGRVPVARCGQHNHASRSTLQRAGLFPCARILRGRVEPSGGQ